MSFHLMKVIVIFFCFCFLSPGIDLAHASEKTSIQLPWHHQFQFAGYYMAKELGYYQDAGLDVDIRDVTQGENTVEEVISSRADFGVSSSGLLIERSLGKPVVAVAAIFQQSPTIFLTLEQSGIHTPKDFIGKKIMLSPGFNSLSLIALLHQEKVFDKIERIDTSFDFHALLQGQTDVFNAYRTNEPNALRLEGYHPHVINPEDYGIHFYGDTLFTSEALLKNKPKLVEKFRSASIKGWKYALAHPDETIQLIQNKYRVTQTPQQLQFEAAEIAKVIQPESVEIGTMGLSRWAQIAQHLIAMGAVPASFHLDDEFLYTPPQGIPWKRLLPLIATVVVALVVLIAFLTVLAKANYRLKIARRETDASERKFRMLADYTTDWEYWVDTQGDYVYISPSCKSISGYDPEDFLNNKQLLYQIVEDAYRDDVQQHFSQEGEDSSPTFSMTFPITTKTGEKRWLEHTCRQVFDENGLPLGRRGNNRDISHRLDLESQLQQKHKMEAIGYMAGGIAHNFNNNLSIILGNIELSQLKQPADSVITPLLENAKIGVRRSRDLVQKIITYSRKGIQNKVQTSLEPIINETISLLQSTLPTTINLQYHSTAEGRSVAVDVDPSQIQEVLINLCNNAIHAMNEKGDLKIYLNSVYLKKGDLPAQYESSPGTYVKLGIEDTGYGIPAENIDKVFDPFFTTKEAYEGAGMGLSTVQGIIVQHGGIIKLSSKPDQGTVFDLYFPAVDQTSSESDTADTSMPKGAERILFVDDDESLAILGEKLLREMGYQVSIMTDSREALKLFTANADKFQLLITDQTMPQLTGTELIQEVKKINPHIAAILCTGFSSKVDEKVAQTIGADTFCMKPIDFPDLLQKIRQVLD